MARPGRLDQLVTLQSVAVTADGGGGRVETWSDFATDPSVWAHVAPRSGNEGMHDGAVNAVGFWRFTIRQRGDVSERDRLIWNGEPYNITRVARASQRELYLIIDAKRGAAQ